MVLLAAAIFSKDGKPILSRQFVEMSRTRIEGLLTAFPKLIGTGKQHTFVETESVRYVYQPLEKLYVLLLTTKASNILEDLETLRLFAKVIPEYSRSLDEYDVKENIFDIINAFDEIVALGYKEHVNLAQIRTFTEMDSHEEKVFLAVRENQVRETKEKMKKKVLEMKSNRDSKSGSYHGGISGSGFGSSSQSNTLSNVPSVVPIDFGTESYSKTTSDTRTTRPTGKAMRLGAGGGGSGNLGGGSGGGGNKSHVVDNFVEQLKAEGVSVMDNNASGSGNTPNVGGIGVNRTRQISNISGGDGVIDNVHVRIEEKLRVDDNHNSGLANMELHGIVMLHVGASDNNYLRLKVDMGDSIQLQTTTHPNIDKKAFQTTGVLQPKALNKAFPIGQDVGLLKWHYQTQDEEMLPLKINCWPSKTANGCSVNIEYELKNADYQLNNVVISIPLPSGSGEPNVREYDGEFSLDACKTHIQWVHEMIDSDNTTGQMEFDTKMGQIEDFFPIFVNFSSNKTFTSIKIEDICDSNNSNINFSSETSFFTDEYKIL